MAQPMEGHMGQIVRSDEPGERPGDFLGYQRQSTGPSENIPFAIGRQPTLHLTAPGTPD